MKTLGVDSLGAASALVGASVLFSLLAQRSVTQQSELASEVLCWAMLPVLFRVRFWPDISGTKPFHYSDTRPTSLKFLWGIATSLTVSCVYKAENGMAELSPLLTPLLIIAQRYLQFEVPASRGSCPSLLSPLLWGTTSCALVATLPFSRWGYGGAALSICAVLPQLLVYIAFLPKEDLGSRRLPPLLDNQRKAATDLCWRIVAVLTVVMGMQPIIFGLAETQIIRAILVGVAKAMSWSFMLRTRQHVSWCIAPAIQTFCGLAAYDPSSQPSDTRAAFNVVASALALAQIIHMLPRRAKSRSILWVFLLASLAPYLANLLALRSAQSSVLRSFSGSHEHPVNILVDDAKVSFETLVQHQSKNYAAACDEYLRRYKIEPPDGFEHWYNFATSHESPIIDDFDTIYRSVSPFWRLSGTEILQIMADAQANSETELWSCIYSGTEAKAHCNHHRRNFDRHISSLFGRLLGNLPVVLPNIKFLVNHLDEPRALIPPQSLESSNNLQNILFNLTGKSQKPVWDALTKYCTSERLHKSPQINAINTFALPFVTDVSSAMDLCQHSEFQALHGFLIQPTSFRLVEGSVPIFSTGSLSTMGDILYPSPAYFEDEFQYDEANDVKWEEKQNNLYWAGSTTGGYASDGQWRHYHRQRFVSLAQNLEHKRHIYLQVIEGVVQRVASKFLNRRLFDVAFTKVFQCKMKYCRAQRAYFKIKPWADKHKAFRSRLAFDIDGNGISGRYYQLLASKSVPLKQTLIREWHDDRLVPWAHYIPVSQSMDEVPELVSYLTNSEAGQRKARDIAELGREWHSKAFREVDFSIYVYRLLLEMARLQDPKRPRYEGKLTEIEARP